MNEGRTDMKEGRKEGYGGRKVGRKKVNKEGRK
jgi:hypothetical protein